MLKFCNLYSGSSGNCSFIQSNNTKLLVDCGNSCKKISEALVSIGTNLSEIDAILLTHEHLDHVKGLQVTCKKYNIPIYASEGTIRQLKQEIPEECKSYFKINEGFDIKDLRILPFSIPHDAADPCGFNIIYNDTKVSIATDIGHMTKSIIKNLEGSSFLLLESNYEPEMLMCSKYPYNLKRRILGPNGHLSNEDASKTINSLVKSGVNNIMLGHLSKENNFPELAYKTVMASIISNNIDSNNLSLTVASRTMPNDLINIS